MPRQIRSGDPCQCSFCRDRGPHRQFLAVTFATSKPQQHIIFNPNKSQSPYRYLPPTHNHRISNTAHSTIYQPCLAKATPCPHRAPTPSSPPATRLAQPLPPTTNRPSATCAATVAHPTSSRNHSLLLVSTADAACSTRSAPRGEPCRALVSIADSIGRKLSAKEGLLVHTNGRITDLMTIPAE